MEVLSWILMVWCVAATCAVLHFAVEASVNRTQVVRLQAQRRMEKEARGKGLHMVPVVEGLWPDLDEKGRLADQVEELKTQLAERECEGCDSRNPEQRLETPYG